MMPSLTKLGARILMGVVAVILLLGVLQVRSCINARQDAAQSRVDDAQHDALKNSAADAVNTMAAQGRLEADSRDLDRDNEREIRNAQGASDRLNPELDAALLRAFCRRAAARNDPRCRVQQPDPS